MSDDTPAAAPAADSVSQSLGPTWRYVSCFLILNPIWIVATGFLFFWFNTAVQRWLYFGTASVPFMQRAIVSFYQWGVRMHFSAFTLAIFIGCIVYGLLRWRRDSYVVKGEFLFVTTGVLIRYSNTVALTLMVDCNISQNAIQSLVGSADLLLRTAEGENIRLRYVAHGEDARDLIMSHARLKNVRMWAKA